MRYTDI